MPSTMPVSTARTVNSVSLASAGMNGSNLTGDVGGMGVIIPREPAGGSRRGNAGLTKPVERGDLPGRSLAAPLPLVAQRPFCPFRAASCRLMSQ